MKERARFGRVVLFLAAFVATGGRLPAQDNLRTELALVAEGIVKTLKERGETSVSVGEFHGPPHLACGSGPLIAKTLGEELAKRGADVKRTARLGVRGNYVDVVDKQSGMLAAHVKATVTDEPVGEVIATFERGVFGDALLATLFGATVQLNPNATAKARGEQIARSLDEPRVTISGTLIQARPDSPYAVEILVAPQADGTYAPRAPRIDDGLAFVPFQRGEVFAVRFHNHTKHDAVVALAVDGLNVFTFSDVKDPKTGRPKHWLFVVGPEKSVVVKGWFRNEKTFDAFLVAPPAGPWVPPAGPKFGTITVTFGAAWRDGDRPPADEPLNPDRYSRCGEPTGTAAGLDRGFREHRLQFGVVREVVSVRYAK